MIRPPSLRAAAITAAMAVSAAGPAMVHAQDSRAPCGTAPIAAESVRALAPVLRTLASGRWTPIHRQSAGDGITFRRQKHGGSAFDTRRRQLVLFGSDTHADGNGSDVPWINSPLIFDLTTLRWHRAYPDDAVDSYAVTAEGIPVAGPRGDHPWAMHTFAALAYDPVADAVVVASFPDHLRPGRFTDALAGVWPAIRRHPTWLFHPATATWQPLPGAGVSFFAYAITWVADLCRVVGLRRDGIYARTPGGWRRLGEGGSLKWGANMVYDTAARRLVALGRRQGRAVVAIIDPASGQVMHTRPVHEAPWLGGQYVAMAYHPGLARTVALFDRPLAPGLKRRERRRHRAETWTYDARTDAWSRASVAPLPFGLGMNYNLAHVPGTDILLLVADPPGGALTVWALRLTPAEMP
ncbi:MAG: hypothetical protein D6826_03880 [Alphaproteobacteria bacterium]|nr:MAG: hypothetical protein D6826_03880 [Alphaproteobacteria bacterium]